MLRAIYLQVLVLCCTAWHANSQTRLLDSLNRNWIEIADEEALVNAQEDAVLYLYQNYQDQDGKQLALMTLAKARSIALPEAEQRMLYMLAYFTHNLGQIDSFNQYWQEAYTASIQLRDSFRINNLLSLKASQYVSELKYDSAFTTYHQAITLAKLNKDSRRQNQLYNDLAIVFAEQGQVDKAKQYFHDAAQASLAINDSSGVFLGHLNVARCFIVVSQIDSAEVYMEMALPWIRASTQSQELSVYYMIAGRVAKFKEQYLQALSFFHQSNKLSATNADDREATAEIGYLHLKLNNFDSAVYYLRQVEILSQQAKDNIALRDVLPALAESYAALGDYSRAYDYAQQSVSLRDTYHAEEVQQQVAEMEAKYQLQLLTADNEKLKAIARERDVIVKQRTLIGLLALLLIAGLAVFVWKRNKTILRFNEELEKKVADRTNDLKAANQKLQDYLEDLRMFTHVTSHDLKEPLRNISGFSSLLERRMKGQEENEDINTFTQMIRSNANQMHRLIEGIQFYAKIDAQGGDEKILDDVSLLEVIEQVKDTLARLINEKKAEIFYPAALPSIYTSASVVQVIMKNLIENGIKYNRSSPPQITVSYHLDDKFHYLVVKDNGIGISTDYQNQIFEMFKRLHTQQEFSGTGMGLAISRKLARRFKGDVLLESEEDKGSTFTLRLPVK